MVRISQHKQQQQKELKEANIKFKPHKHNFSPELASKLYEFSEAHHKDHFKVFNKALEAWTQENQSLIAVEIERSDSETIYDKIKTSARFYYRKKSKKEQKEQEQQKEQQKTKKPYIGLSQPFIIAMDEFIKNELILCSKISSIEYRRRKTSFADFTQTNIERIKDELKVLKEKYDEANTPYEPKEISHKIKKAFDNRFYIFTEQL
jgi:hypothetical protein